jgi:hypothetical protein
MAYHHQRGCREEDHREQHTAGHENHGENGCSAIRHHTFRPGM